MKAAELNTSVSVLVKRYLTELGAGEFLRLKRLEHELRSQVPVGFRVSENLGCDQVHLDVPLSVIML